MKAKIRKVSSSVTVAGQKLPVLSWEVKLGSSGSISTVRASTSVSILNIAGIDLDGLNSDQPTIEVRAGYDDNEQLIFAGVLDKALPTFHADTVSFTGRDFGALLADSKQMISKIDYKNKTIGQIVTNIAKQQNLTPDVTDPGIKAGADLWDENAYMPHAQPWWSILQTLARQCGYEVKVTPEKTLFFGPPDKAGGEQISVTWGAQEGDPNPLIECEGEYSPRRNGNFEVHVISYHPQRGQLIKATATSDGQSITMSSSSSKSVGSRKKKARTGGGGSNSTSTSKKPVLTFHMDGLTQEQAQERANGIAKDIAKREVILRGVLEGLPSLKVHSTLKLLGNLPLLGWDKRDFVVTEAEHSYSVPQGNSQGGGYRTSFTAMSGVQGAF